jgi:hypothetical protein
VSAIRLPLEQYSPPDDHIEVDSYEGLVHVDIHLGDLMASSERISVSLAPPEARALASMLTHHAGEVAA